MAEPSGDRILGCMRKAGGGWSVDYDLGTFETAEDATRAVKEVKKFSEREFPGGQVRLIITSPLGPFGTPEEAAKARDAFARQYEGTGVIVTFPDASPESFDNLQMSQRPQRVQICVALNDSESRQDIAREVNVTENQEDLVQTQGGRIAHLEPQYASPVLGQLQEGKQVYLVTLE